MAFKSDNQRKAVMAKLNQGYVRSDVKPEIINNKDDIRDSKYFKEMINLGLKYGNRYFGRPEYRKSYIKDRKLGMTIAEANKSLFIKIRIRDNYRARQKLRDEVRKRLLKRDLKKL